MFNIQIENYFKVMEDIKTEFDKACERYHIEMNLNQNIYYFTSEQKMTYDGIDGYFCFIKGDSNFIPYQSEFADTMIFQFYEDIFADFVFQFGPVMTVIPTITYADLKIRNKMIIVKTEK